MRALLIASVLLLSGCTSIVSVSQSSISVQRGKGIEAVDEGSSYFGLEAPLLRTSEKLAKQCPGGIVTGVETTLYKTEIIIVQAYKLRATASCQMPDASKPVN